MAVPSHAVTQLSQDLRVILLSSLGTFIDGRKAIWVRKPDHPEMREGLLCLINRYAETSGRRGYKHWRVYLLNYGEIDIRSGNLIVTDASMQKLDTATRLIERTYPDSDTLPVIGEPGDTTQVSFRLRYPHSADLSAMV